MIILPKNCPVCASPYMTWVKTLSIKVGGSVELFYCMECESFSSPFSKPIANAPTQLNWHKSVLERNIGWSISLLDILAAKSCSGTLVDIGCGIGSLLLAAKNKGWRGSGVGYDLDVDACSYGRSAFSLDLRSEVWRAETSPEFGLITCISVLEHIHQPRFLINEMIIAARQRSAKVYLSVPFFNRIWWRMILEDSSTPGHPFEYPHAHVTHFSYKGMETICDQLNVKSAERVKIDSAWIGYLINP